MLKRSTVTFILAYALIGCSKQPAELRIKLPTSYYPSSKSAPVLPAFKKKGSTIRMRASLYDAKGAYFGAGKVRWSSSDPSVATVALDGLVSVISSGTTEIRASSVEYQGLTAGFPVKAVIVDKVEIVPPEALGKPSIHLGETHQFTAKVFDDRGSPIPNAEVKWRTSTYAATVTPSGELEGRAIGGTQLIAQVGTTVAKYPLSVLDWKRGARR